MCRPSMIVYLDLSPEVSKARIEQRSRGVESGITLEYLRALHRRYDEFIQDIAHTIPVIRVPWNEFQDVEETARRIEQAFQQGSFLREVAWKRL
jgi:deoxyadenosine/deoxycytidine kinase